MPVFTTKEEYFYAECLPITIYREGLPFAAIIGDGTPGDPATEADKARAAQLRDALAASEPTPGAVHGAGISEQVRLACSLAGTDSPAGLQELRDIVAYLGRLALASEELAHIRAAVKTHDDRLNNGVGDKGPQPPNGDDYNDLFALIMDGVPPEVPTGFDKAIREAQDRREGDLARRIMAERRMAMALVERALRDGYTVSVHDGEEWPVSRSTDRAVILGALFTTDEDTLQLRQQNGDYVGWFQLIYGNSGWDVVSDHSDNPICNAIWEETLRPLSDRIEAGR